MRRTRDSISLAIIVMSAIAVGFAGTGNPGGRLTGSDFARELAVVATSAGDTELSRSLLQTDLGSAAGAQLTEGTAAILLKAAGISATTSNPDRVLTRDRADALVRQIKASLAPAPRGAAVVLKNAGVPTDIERCLDEKNTGQCVDCCKEQGGSASTCAKACQVNSKPSSSEPLP
jgi:hypothetical protein